jgi:hypothetical protein
MIEIRNCSKTPGVTSQTFSYPADWANEFGSVTAAIVAWAIYSYWVDTRNTHIVICQPTLGEETGLHGNEMSEGLRVLAEKGIIEEVETKNDTSEQVIRFNIRKMEELFNNPESYLREIGEEKYELNRGRYQNGSAELVPPGRHFPSGECKIAQK